MSFIDIVNSNEDKSKIALESKQGERSTERNNIKLLTAQFMKQGGKVKKVKQGCSGVFAITQNLAEVRKSNYNAIHNQTKRIVSEVKQVKKDDKDISMRGIARKLEYRKIKTPTGAVISSKYIKRLLSEH